MSNGEKTLKYDKAYNFELKDAKKINLDELNSERDFLNVFKEIQESFGIKTKIEFENLRKEGISGSYNEEKNIISIDKKLIKKDIKEFSKKEKIKIIDTFMHECIHKLDFDFKLKGMSEKDKKIILLERLAFKDRVCYKSNYTQIWYEARAFALSSVFTHNFLEARVNDPQKENDKIICEIHNDKVKDGRSSIIIGEKPVKIWGEMEFVDNVSDMKKECEKVVENTRDKKIREKSISNAFPDNRDHHWWENEYWNKDLITECKKMDLKKMFDALGNREEQLSFMSSLQLLNSEKLIKDGRRKNKVGKFFDMYKDEFKRYEVELNAENWIKTGRHLLDEKYKEDFIKTMKTLEIKKETNKGPKIKEGYEPGKNNYQVMYDIMAKNRSGENRYIGGGVIKSEQTTKSENPEPGDKW